jgi:hypothetical protein
VALDFSAAGDGAAATWLDGAGALAIGRSVALGLGRTPPASSPVAPFGEAPASLADPSRGGVLDSFTVVLISRDVLPGSRDRERVVSEAPFVSPCAGASPSPGRKDIDDFVLARPPVPSASSFGRASRDVSWSAGRLSETTGFSASAGDWTRVKLSFVWPGWPRPANGFWNSQFTRSCPIFYPASDNTSAAIVTPLNTPTSFAICVPDGRRQKLRVVSNSSISSSSEES